MSFLVKKGLKPSLTSQKSAAMLVKDGVGSINLHPLVGHDPVRSTRLEGSLDITSSIHLDAAKYVFRPDHCHQS